jgi:hypothetical protein
MAFSMDGSLQSRFLLASLQLHHVLQETGQSNMREALKTLPTTTDEAFDTMLERIEARGPISAKNAFRTLTWCYYAQRPLQMEELREALAVQDGDKELQRNENSPTSNVECCLSFITHDQSTGEVRFAHPSVQRWFKEKRQNQKLLPHGYLAETCLTYLNFGVFDVPLGDSKGIEPDDLISKYAPYRFYRYATEFWGDHTREAEQEPKVQRASLAFLEAENRRNLMLRTAARIQYKEYHNGQSSLHVAASHGLAALCHMLLDENMK